MKVYCMLTALLANIENVTVCASSLRDVRM